MASCFQQLHSLQLYYLIQGDGADSTTFNYFDGDNGFQGDNGGQIIITDINTETQEISGTFQGVASGSFGSTTTYTISNGSFGNLPYTIQ